MDTVLTVQHMTERVKSIPGLVKCVPVQMHIFKNLKTVFQRNIKFAKNWQNAFKLGRTYSWLTGGHQ